MAYIFRQQFVTEDKYYCKCPKTMSPIGICIHNTANSASAKNEINYMVRNDNYTSYHVAIDDIEVVQAIPFDRNAYHSGDGANGLGNTKYIGIEICYSTDYGSNKFDKAQENAIEYVANLCRQYGWTIDNIRGHRDFSSKNCPHRTDLNWFKEQVGKRLNSNESNSKPPQDNTPKLVSMETSKKVLGDRCKDIQTKLIYLGYDLGQYQNNGVFGQMTYNAIVSFQKDHSDVLDVDGSCGNATTSLINKLYNEKVESNKPKQPQADNSPKLGTHEYARNYANKNLDIRDIQKKLDYIGFSMSPYGADGSYGQHTFTRVKEFQLKYGLSVDGNVGSITLAKINEVYNAKVAQNQYPKYGVVTATAGLRVRNGASRSSSILGTLKYNETVKIGFTQGSWHNIYYGSNGGWVSADYIRIK